MIIFDQIVKVILKRGFLTQCIWGVYIHQKKPSHIWNNSYRESGELLVYNWKHSSAKILSNINTNMNNYKIESLNDSRSPSNSYNAIISIDIDLN